MNAAAALSSPPVTTRRHTPIERSVLGVFGEGRWNAGDRATITAGVRGEHITRDALPGDPLRLPAAAGLSGRDRQFGESEDCRQLPRRRLAGRRPRVDAPQGAFGTGIRPPDAFEIAFTDNSGLKPERSKSGEFGVTQTLAGGAVQIDATAFFNSLHGLDHFGGPHVLGCQPVAHRQHLKRACARRGVRRCVARHRRGSTSAASYTFLDSGDSRRQRIVRRANAIFGRRPAAAPSEAFGFGRCGLERITPSAHSRSCRSAVRRSTPSRPSGRPAASTPNPDTPSSTWADRGESVKPVEIFVARAEPVRSRIRGSAGVSGAGSHGLRGCASCCGQITFRSGMRRARRSWWTGSPSASAEVRSSASSDRTGPARPRCCGC